MIFYTIHLFKVYNSMVFSIFSVVLALFYAIFVCAVRVMQILYRTLKENQPFFPLLLSSFSLSPSLLFLPSLLPPSLFIFFFPLPLPNPASLLSSLTSFDNYYVCLSSWCLMNDAEF